MPRACCVVSDTVLIVVFILLIFTFADNQPAFFGENESLRGGIITPNVGYYTTQAEIWSASSVGYFKDATELS